MTFTEYITSVRRYRTLKTRVKTKTNYQIRSVYEELDRLHQLLRTDTITTNAGGANHKDVIEDELVKFFLARFRIFYNQSEIPLLDCIDERYVLLAKHLIIVYELFPKSYRENHLTFTLLFKYTFNGLYDINRLMAVFLLLQEQKILIECNNLTQWEINSNIGLFIDQQCRGLVSRSIKDQRRWETLFKEKDTFTAKTYFESVLTPILFKGILDENLCD